MFSTFDPHGWEDGFDLEAGDPSDDSYCENCDREVDYSSDPAGVCGCDEQPHAAAAYAVKCDDCRQDIRRTDSIRESAAGGRCDECVEVAA